ncbi:ABC transporter ATP-binding protein [Roseateles toxinivorans]|uniref:Microcin C transport system ATP-binding protein n=1 Tax=Roseateles toxinivorans TaxID=270368 RepID=A0A4R6QMS2_9BURK|nr:dipeptide ABC transporter ATP-binding protein [Roseateles toxinivorans]TDP72266.1 microcin C transport system ATP-binding protein [Roseateles toxinivorans]
MTPHPAPLLQVEALDVRFGATHAVRKASFQIAAGEKFALVGESGSGKSVTALALLRLMHGAQIGGRILFDGQDLTVLPEDQMRALRGARIAMIFQEPMTALNPVFPVGSQIAEVLQLHAGMDPKAARQRAIDLLTRTGIADAERRVDDFPHQLSGGQRQRVVIAMALACKPSLLVCDEPTTALDVTVQAQILALLDELQAEMGMALLFITHDLGLVRRFTHRVGVMERGLLVETGNTEAVFADPQHPYTQKLLASRPQRAVQPLLVQTPELLQGRGMRVEYHRSATWWRREVNAAVDGVNLAVRRGETLGIVGESGSGKTTLSMALLALQPMAQGDVHLGKQRMDTARGAALRQLRRRVQVVFQDPFASLSPRLTVGQIVGEGLSLHRLELTPAERELAVLKVLDEVGLSSRQGVDGVLHRYPHEFSGGQRQRIAIARALVIAPDLLILDEPTSALDISVQKQVLELLAELQRRHGLSYIFISHDLSVIRAMAHRVMVMRHGRVVEEGETEALFAAPREAYTRELLAATQYDWERCA